MIPRILIIAFGNPLRGDDGVAWHAADLLRERLSWDEVQIVCAHQLTPELAECVSQAAGAIFLDARQNGKPGYVSWTRVVQRPGNIYGTHMLTPTQLTALSYALYGNWTDAYEVSVTGESFTHGEALSDNVKRSLPQMIDLVDRLTKQMQHSAARTGGANIGGMRRDDLRGEFKWKSGSSKLKE